MTTEKPKNGSYADYYDNEQIKLEANYKDGKLQGKGTFWYESGHIEAEMNFKDDKMEGKSTEWYENGQKKFEKNYKDNKKKGKSTVWYENGQKKSEINYKDDKLQGKGTFWHESGHIFLNANYKDDKKAGRWTQWYDNGQIESDGNYKDGKRDGKLTEWYANGQIKFEADYKDDKLDGKWTQWLEDGQIDLEINYKDGKQEGKTTYWDDDGNVIAYLEYEDNELVWSYLADKNTHFNLGALGIGGFPLPDEEVATTYKTFPKELTHTPFMNLWLTWYIFETNLESDSKHKHERKHIDAYQILPTHFSKMRKVVPSEHWHEISKEYYPNETSDWWMDDDKLLDACRICFYKHRPRYEGFIRDDTDGYLKVDDDFLGKWKVNPHDEFWRTEESIDEYIRELDIQGTDEERCEHLKKLFGEDNLPIWADKICNKD